MKQKTSTQQIKPIVKKSVCEHHWKRIEYGYNKEYFKCKLCGKTEW